MAKFVTEGTELADFMKDLRLAGENIENYSEKAIYKAAEYMADNIKASLEGMKTYGDKNGLPNYAPKGYKLKGLSPIQKQDVINGFGISKIKTKDGVTSVSIGFDGYGRYKTRKHPKGVPNQLLMRSLEKGTYFLKQNKIVSRTFRKSKNKTAEILKDEFIKEMKRR